MKLNNNNEEVIGHAAKEIRTVATHPLTNTESPQAGGGNRQNHQHWSQTFHKYISKSIKTS